MTMRRALRVSHDHNSSATPSLRNRATRLTSLTAGAAGRVTVGWVGEAGLVGE